MNIDSKNFLVVVVVGWFVTKLVSSSSREKERRVSSTD